MILEISDIKFSSLKEKIFLGGNALKVIAIIAMTIDHITWMGIEEYSQAETPIQIFLHCIGRLTAPIMIFFVAEGYHYTKNYWKYLGRMAMLAVISHFAFGLIHLACWFSVPLLSMYNGRRGNVKWLGKFFYFYYPIHLILIGLITHSSFPNS